MPRPSTGTDVHVYELLDKTVPLFCKYNIHPNIVTFLSILTKPILYKLVKTKVNPQLNIILLLILVHSVLDCLDGEVARGCNMRSTFGSRLDALNDTIFIGLMLTCLLNKFNLININSQNITIVMFIHTFYNIAVNKFNLDTHEMKDPVSIFIHNNSVIVSIIAFLVIFLT